MKRKIKGYGISYVKFNALGGFQEKFISSLIDNNIQLYDIAENKCELSALIKASDYFFVSRIARKYGVKTRVSERQGLYFKLYGYRKRWGLILGPLCCALTILILSQFVWDIRISGNENLSDNQLYSVAEDCGIEIGSYIKNFSVAACEFKAMAEMNLLSWISVEREGSRIYIKVQEKAIEPKEEIPAEMPCNIVSEYDGQLVYALVKRGVSNVKIGDGIRKGQVLISGAVDNNNDGVIHIHAEGELIARCQQTEEFYIPFKQNKRKPVDEKKYTSYIMFGDFSMKLPWESYEPSDSENVTYKEETGYIDLFGFKIPMKYKKGIYTFYENEEITYKQEDVIKQLNEQKSDFEDNFMQECKVVSAVSEIIPEVNGIRMKVTYVVERDVGVKQKISVRY